jgi:hypothetical protein
MLLEADRLKSHKGALRAPAAVAPSDQKIRVETAIKYHLTPHLVDSLGRVDDRQHLHHR